MTTIPHRELRNNSSDVLRRVAAGEVFEITNHGVVVAELHAPRQSPLAGVSYRPALIRGRFSELRPVKSDLTTQEIMDELRGDR